MRFAAILVLAGVLLAGGFALAQPAHAPYAPAEVRVEDAAAVRRLARLEIDIDRVRAGWARVYVTQEEFSALQAAGWEIGWIPDEAAAAWKALHEAGLKANDPLMAYHTFAEMTALLQGWATQYPEIMRLTSIGSSVQGRALWMVKITDNPDVEEDEPEFKYIATMHGDEILGTEVMLDLIRRLLEGYGTDERLTNLVDETVIWIMPMMNPDGWEASPPVRRNANNVDLNRNFPRWACTDANTTTGRQAETAAVMNWSATRFETLSANLHGGEMVANYPLDECSTCNNFSCTVSISQDDDVFQAVSRAYSFAHGRMWQSTEFVDGITNGAAWYPVYGGMQDWNYRYMGCMEITLELEDEKIPSLQRLPGLIAENREAVVAYMEWVHRGVRGIVRDAHTGAPLGARVRLGGRAFTTRTNPAVGNFHRVAMPGTYSLHVEADGYLPATITGVVVTAGEATRVNVNLVREGANAFDAWAVH
jgi:carboxypeptidase D